MNALNTLGPMAPNIPFWLRLLWSIVCVAGVTFTLITIRVVWMFLRSLHGTHANVPAAAIVRNATRRRRADPVDVSIVVPSYNEGAWLRETVASILRSATNLRYEIVVVDDGCTDGSLKGIACNDKTSVIHTGGRQLGPNVAKNTGAKAARGRYLCFVDSHVLVHDYWLDYLRETCDGSTDGALVSGLLFDIDHDKVPADYQGHQYGYIVQNCNLHTGWHDYGYAYSDKPYLEPLAPGGLMFTRKRHFASLGGFASVIKHWGVEDVQISLQNYCLGGDNIVDPRVIVYHRYKKGTNNDRAFTIDALNYAFNRLCVAYAYFSDDYYVKVREAILSESVSPTVVSQVECPEYRQRAMKLRFRFVRSFDDWIAQFSNELAGFIKDAAVDSSA